MFKYKGRYYAASSDLHGWNTSHTYYISSDNILGPYNSEKIMINTDLDYSHVTQCGFFITVNGTEDTTVIYCGDRWSNNAGNGIGYNQWCPITIEGTTCTFNSLSQWSIDPVKGTWKMGPKNNQILNPCFEADRITVGSVVGWEGNDANAKGSPGAGNFCLSLGAGATATQRIPENSTIADIPPGTYELKAWVRCSGGGNGQIAISGFGGSEMTKSSNATSWTEISIPNVAISTGNATVSASNTGGGTCLMDDFSLIKSGTDTLYGVNATAAPGGIIEQSPAGDSIIKGGDVTFTATPFDGWEFAEWSGDHTGTDPSYTISSLNTHVTLNASFSFVSTDSSLYEGENAHLINSIVESTNEGFTGAGYANFENMTGSAVQFPVCVSEAGEKNVVIRYSNGADDQRPVSVSVNGAAVLNSLEFSPTGEWTLWDSVTISAQLNSGINTITFTALTEEGGPNIDNIELVDPVSVVAKSHAVTQSVFFNVANYTIHAHAPGKAADVKLYSVDGRLIMSRSLSGKQTMKLPVQQMTSGRYILSISRANSRRREAFNIVK